MIIKHERKSTGPYVEHKITIVSMNKPQTPNINHELQWFGSSLGLFNLRDKDRSCFRLFIELLKAAKRRTPLTSDELADRTQLTRGTVMHHMNKLIDAGIVITLRNKYTLRADTLEKLTIELKKDVDNAFSKLTDVAIQIDNRLGL